VTAALTWLVEARRYIGQREVPGPHSNEWIKAMWLSLRGGAWYWTHFGSDDSKLPWCGGFMAFVFQNVKITFPSAYGRALAWLEWGEPCGPAVGAVAVLGRPGAGAGHVGIVTAVSIDGNHVRLLGGNQNDGVTDAWFKTERVRGYRRPPGQVLGETVYARVEVGGLSASEA
jgi:uncharacterized protein (TIGR02594 family)